MNWTFVHMHEREFSVTVSKVLSLAVPLTLAYLSTPLVGLADTVVVGQFGSTAELAGIALAGLIFDVLFTTVNFLHSGTSGLIAQALGQGDSYQERLVLFRALCLALLLGGLIVLAQSAVLALGLWTLAPSAATADALSSYFFIRILSTPAVLINTVFRGYLSGRGQGRYLFIYQTALNLGNIVLSIILGIYLNLGLAGVAWATVLAEVGMAVFGLMRFASLKSWPQVWPALRANGQAWKRLVSVNADIMFRSFALTSVFFIFGRIGTASGEVVLAANALLLHLFFFCAFFLDGMASAAEQLVGRAVGAGAKVAFQRTIRLCLKLGFLTASMLSLIYFLFGAQLLQAMTVHEPVRQTAGQYLGFCVLIPLISWPAFLYDGVFIGATWTKAMRQMMIVSFAFFVLLLQILPKYYGNTGLWGALVIFLALRGVTLAWRCNGCYRAQFT